MKMQADGFSSPTGRRSFDPGSKEPEPNNSQEDDEMRTLSVAEIDQVSGGIDSINIGGINITGIEAGLALRNVMGAASVAFGVGYAGGVIINNTWQAVSGDSLGTDIYQMSASYS
jgi:hypothetical protein